MAKKDNYHVVIGDLCFYLSLEQVVRIIRSPLPRPAVWSARLSTGIIGLTNCHAGNRGPKKDNEILLALGNAGLCKLIELGFITCPVCHPENISNFWNIVGEIVQRKYAITSLDEFVDKTILPFDARRIVWENIIPLLGQWPGRLYVPRGLQKNELKELRARIEKIGYGSPLVGYSDAPGRFTQYDENGGASYGT